MMQVNNEVESAVIGMADVGFLTEAALDAIEDGDTEKAEHAVIVLQEIFASRYAKLRAAFYAE